ncbi:transposase domain-containing protein, partial [Mesorhizobium waimense]|uniref:transposase domain-containing protein n=1 Tax=Mesorhizobium waimense TaxID=1300307 RepID=UPI001FE076A1
ERSDRWRVLHCSRSEAGVRNTDASDNGLRPPAQHGQNDPEIALGRKSWLFAGSDRGADRAAFMATLIMSAKLNDIDPQAWLGDVLARIADIPVKRLEELLPWNWQSAKFYPKCGKAA